MNTERNIKVLNLVRWYPNKFDPMPGLFIQRHVESTSHYCQPGVVYTHQVENGWDSDGTYKSDISMINGVPTAKIYYRASCIKLQPLRKLINIIRFFKANSRGIKVINDELEGIDIIHVHILTRLGLIALYHKITRRRPYVITEHWSRYLDLTGDFKGVFRKLMTRVVVKNAASVTAVTENLANAMQMHGLRNKVYKILPNVVDDVFLSVKNLQKKSRKTNFVHVSCFEDRSKNVSGLLRVIKELSLERDDFYFTFVGDGMDFESMREYERKLKIREGMIYWKGLLEGHELVMEMTVADMLVIFSNYENFPVVINESLCLGVPVIATRVGGIPERINRSNGYLVNPGDEKGLLLGLRRFLNKKLKFDMPKVKVNSRKEFSPLEIGSSIYQMYKNALR